MTKIKNIPSGTFNAKWMAQQIESRVAYLRSTGVLEERARMIATTEIERVVRAAKGEGIGEDE